MSVLSIARVRGRHVAAVRVVGTAELLEPAGRDAPPTGEKRQRSTSSA